MFRLFIGILSLMFFTAGCTDDSERIRAFLDDVDTMLGISPNVAFDMLDSVDVKSLPENMRPWHTLLSVKAFEKTYRHYTDDSLTEMAVEYYRGKGDSLEVQSLYYNGVVNGYNKKYADALISLIEATDRAREAGDWFYRAMAFREQADIYGSLMVESKRLEFADSAQLNFMRVGRSIYALRERLSMAQALISLNRTDEAIILLKKLRHEPGLTSAPAYLAAYHRAMSEAYESNGLYESAVSQLDSLRGVTHELTSAELSKLSSLYAAIGDSKAADETLTEAHMFVFEPNDTLSLNYAIALNARLHSDYRSAFDAFKDYHDAFARSRKQLLNYPYTAIVGEYFRRQAESRSRELDMSRTKMWMVVAIIALLAALVSTLAFYYRRLYKERENQRVALLTDVENLQAVIANHADSGVRKSATRHFALVNRLLELSDKVPDSNEGYALLGKNVSKLVGNFNSEDNMSAIEGFINECYDNVIEKFRNRYPDLTERNYRFMVLSAAGFSIQSIVYLLDLKSAAAARMMRHRLRRLIEENPTEDSGLFKVALKTSQSI